MSDKLLKSAEISMQAGHKRLHLIIERQAATVFELLRPGSFATLDNQPNDLPPFEVINCKGGRCWVRQQSWGNNIQWEVDHRQLNSA